MLNIRPQQEIDVNFKFNFFSFFMLKTFVKDFFFFFFLTLIAKASVCTSSLRTEIAVVSKLNLFNHGTI